MKGAREKAQQQEQRDRESRRLEARVRKASRAPPADCEDPHIAGITPDPQPLPEQWNWTRGKKD